MGIVDKLKKLGTFGTKQYEDTQALFNFDILYKDLKHDDDDIIQGLFKSVKTMLSEYIGNPSEDGNIAIDVAGKNFDSFCAAKRIDVVVFLIVIHKEDPDIRDVFYLDNTTSEVRLVAW
jgi:hypothetical protein